ncbi:MAG: tetratricopeptide repeat protein [Ferruginibacter sp.]
MKFIPAFLIIYLLGITNDAHGQYAYLSAESWFKKLSDPADKRNKWYDTLDKVLMQFDSTVVFNFLREVEIHSKKEGDHSLVRFNCIKANQLYYQSLGPSKELPLNNRQVKKEIITLLSQAMHKAYESNDDYQVAFVSGVYGKYMSAFGETEPGVMYMMNCADLYEKVNLTANFATYVSLGETLWRVREYEKCIKYTHKAMNALINADDETRFTYAIMCPNTIALAYHRLGMYDSAFKYYRQGLKATEEPAVLSTITNPLAWKGIISGNMAQIYFSQAKYTTALPLFELDYKVSKENHYYDNAANSLQWAARTNLALGKTTIALQQVREAFALLIKMPSPNYLQNTFFTAAEIFKSLNNQDSTYHYNSQYNKLHDSIERVIYQSSISISKLRLNEEKSRYSIMNLQREKQSQLQQRNWIIAAIVFLFAIVLLLINRQRLKLKYRQQLAEQEKRRIEQEMESAREQLQLFTQNIIEKTNLIEQLEQRVQDKTMSAENQQVLSALSNQTILTEDDWSKFKSLFEKIFPLFFQRLKNTAADITTAEQRMAALTKLQLTTRQMASMLGISVDSVHKTRQRLRKRFNLAADANLEEYIAGI